VAVVSESVAQRYWPGQDPVGRRLQFVPSAEWPWVTVVGVAADTRYRELTKPWMTVYFPADQFFYFQAASLLVRTASPPDALVQPSCRGSVRSSLARQSKRQRQWIRCWRESSRVRSRRWW